MNPLQAGGNSAQLIRDPGTANAVQGFWATGIVDGTELTFSLPTTVFMQAGDGFAQEPQILPTKVWVNISEVWKEVEEVYICIGETWKLVTEMHVCIGESWEMSLG